MKALIRVTLALVAAAVVSPSYAAPAKLPPEAAAAHNAAASVIRARLATASLHRLGTADAGAGVDAIQTTVSGPRQANAVRAYPPSCLADPLPTAPSGPTDTFQMSLYTRSENGDPLEPETVTVQIWRVACSSSGTLTPYNTDGLQNAALLMRITRDQVNDGHTDYFPTFPYLTAIQTNTTPKLVRAAMEPNTVVSDGPFDAPVYVSTTYVIENYPYVGSGVTLFNYRHDLTIDPVIGGFGTSAVTRPIQDYAPNQTSYPAAFQNLTIDGYLSSAWYSPGHGGEGLVVEIYDNADGTTRTIFAAWYTYDVNGLPFWLVAQGVMNLTANSVANVPVYYYTGGGFAGDFTGVDTNNWGTMSISFPDCQTMNFTYNGATDASIGGPSGTGSRTWKRLADINGLNCE
jgi:hypothetical protein